MAQVINDQEGNRWLQMPDGSYQAMMGLVSARGIDQPASGYGGRRYGPVPPYQEVPYGQPMPGPLGGIPMNLLMLGVVLWFLSTKR